MREQHVNQLANTQLLHKDNGGVATYMHAGLSRNSETGELSTNSYNADDQVTGIASRHPSLDDLNKLDRNLVNACLEAGSPAESTDVSSFAANTAFITPVNNPDVAEKQCKVSFVSYGDTQLSVVRINRDTGEMTIDDLEAPHKPADHQDFFHKLGDNVFDEPEAVIGESIINIGDNEDVYVVASSDGVSMLERTTAQDSIEGICAKRTIMREHMSQIDIQSSATLNEALAQYSILQDGSQDNVTVVSAKLNDLSADHTTIIGAMDGSVANKQTAKALEAYKTTFESTLADRAILCDINHETMVYDSKRDMDGATKVLSAAFDIARVSKQPEPAQTSKLSNVFDHARTSTEFVIARQQTGPKILTPAMAAGLN